MSRFCRHPVPIYTCSLSSSSSGRNPKYQGSFPCSAVKVAMEVVGAHYENRDAECDVRLAVRSRSFTPFLVPLVNTCTDITFSISPENTPPPSEKYNCKDSSKPTHRRTST